MHDAKVKKTGGWTINPIKLARLAYDAVSMIVAYFRGEYPHFPLSTILAVAAGAVYFLVPTDAIPDFLLGFGWLDDAAVITILLNLINSDIQKFREWKNAPAKIIDAEYTVIDDDNPANSENLGHKALIR